jgi:pimeloyl-ACP methyl ester carboxylesterase
MVISMCAAAALTECHDVVIAEVLEGIKSGHWRKPVEQVRKTYDRAYKTAIMVEEDTGACGRGWMTFPLSFAPTKRARILLTSDVIAIIDKLVKDRVYVVGHDWGATIAWSVAIQYPDRVIRLAILNVPHPMACGTIPAPTPRQLLKSWYALFFQLPWLPEFLISANDFWSPKRRKRVCSFAPTAS